ncbi:MAG TPA: SRPBCC family protein [Bryobacteraceae bacterium]|nr:SRPBCC family protein [Bryobacteraceae bacterium]
MQILQARKPNTNVGEAERWLSLIGGSSLVAYGLARRNSAGFGLAALGGSLLWRGATGHCPMYQTLGVNTSERGYAKGTGSRAGVPYELGIRVDHEITINKPIGDLYAFWRDLCNLPKFMDHLQTVKVINDRVSRWTAKGPAGINVEWDAEIVNDIPEKVIGWRSLEGSDVDNGGSVRFDSLGANSTLVRVSLQYNPPAGQLGEWVARLFGEDPKKTIAEDLQRFKELMETGNVITKASKKRRVGVKANARYSGSSGKQWERDAVTSSSEESFPASDPPSWTPETL